MKKYILFVIFSFQFLFSQPCQMWYEDNNLGIGAHFPQDAKEKFLHPKSWEKSLKNMDVYLVRANSLYIKQNRLTDYFIKNKMLKMLQKNHVKFALDVRGATLSNTSKKRKNIRLKEMKLIKSLACMGAHIDSINFQSPLSKSVKTARERKKKYASTYPIDQRIEDIVSYAKIVHNQFPHIKFGLIDALPTKGYFYKKPYLKLKMAMEKEHLTLNHIILDLPYTFIKKHKHGMTWEKTIAVEKYVQNELHLKFGKIFHDSKGGKSSDRLFYTNVMKMAKQYTAKGGTPDYCLLMSWYPHPAYTIPETKKYTQMYTFIELSKVVNK